MRMLAVLWVLAVGVCVQAACGPNAIRVSDTSCVCEFGFFSSNSNDPFAPGAECAPCPTGAICNKPGATVVDLQSVEGYWRSGNASLDFVRCPRYSDCVGGPVESQCANNRQGVLCALCVDGSRAIGTTQCEACPSTDYATIRVVVYFVVVFTVLSVLFFVVLQVAETPRPARSGLVLQRKFLNPSADAVELFDPETQLRVDRLSTQIRTPPTLTFNIKIIVSFLQIITALTVVVDIPWPAYFQLAFSYADFINLAVVPWNTLGCLYADATDFYTHLVFTVSWPAAIIFVSCTVVLIPLACLDRRDARNNLPQAVEPNADLTALAAAQASTIMDPERFMELQRGRNEKRRTLARAVLFVLFMVYPGVSAAVLRIFACQDVAGESYLVADFRQKCSGSQHDLWMFIGYALIAIYVFGVPCALFFLVRGHAEIIRKFHFDSDRRQQPPRSDLGLEFVFEAFHEQFWYWDLLDTAHKLFMTSCLVFIPTTFQLPAAMAATWLSMSLVLWMNPYVRSVDDRMHTFASAELITLLLGAHVINHQSRSDGISLPIGSWADVVLSAIFLLLAGGALLLFLRHTLVHLRIRFKQATHAAKRHARSSRELHHNPVPVPDGQGQALSAEEAKLLAAIKNPEPPAGEQRTSLTIDTSHGRNESVGITMLSDGAGSQPGQGGESLSETELAALSAASTGQASQAHTQTHQHQHARKPTVAAGGDSAGHAAPSFVMSDSNPYEMKAAALGMMQQPADDISSLEAGGGAASSPSDASGSAGDGASEAAAAAATGADGSAAAGDSGAAPFDAPPM